MTEPSRARMSYRGRLRLAFALLVLGTLGAATATAFLLVRNANADDARREATTVARSSARASGAEISAFINSDDFRPAQVSDLARRQIAELATENAEAVRLGRNGIRAVFPTDEPPGARLPVTGVPVRALVNSELAAGEEVILEAQGSVMVATPIRYNAADREILGLGDDVLAVVVVRDLGTGGLGSAAPGLLATLAVALVIAGLLAEFLAHRVRAPLAAVATASRRLSTGDLSARVELDRPTDREMADIADTVNEMASQLETSQQDRQRFLMDVSHELRTPLTSVRGYAELLAESGSSEADADQLDVAAIASIINRESQRMERLVDDLLAQTRLDTGALTVATESVDLAALAREAIAAQRVHLRDREVTMRGPHPGQSLVVLADPLRTSQVLTNLVANAADFATSEITVSVHRDAHHGILEVTDDGPGLEGKAEQVFDRNWRGSQPVDRQGGAGLGLSIVAELVHAMDGSVRALDLSPGSRFEVRLPLE